MLRLFVCDVLSSETCVLGARKTCLKIQESSQVLALDNICLELCCYYSLFIYYLIYPTYFIILCFIILCQCINIIYILFFTLSIFIYCSFARIYFF